MSSDTDLFAQNQEAQRRVWNSATVQPVRGQTSEDYDRFSALRESSDGKSIKNERRRTADHIELLLNSTGEGIFGVDQQGRFTFINRAGAAMLGYAVEEILGYEMQALIHHQRLDRTPYPKRSCPIDRSFREGVSTRINEDVFWRKDGTPQSVEYSSYPIQEDGAVRGAVVVFSDISDRRQLEEQYRQTQKIEAIGQLAGGVAHDFNNLLTIISGYTEILLDSVRFDVAGREALEEIRKAAERSTSLTRQILAFSRKQVLAPKVLDLNDVVRDTDKMLRRIIGEDVQLTTILHPQLDSVRADRGQFEQILLNLAINARDAMPKGGKLTIETRNIDLKPGRAGFHAGIRPGRFVILSVTDSGTGMTETVKRQIFEPFFTTKEQGRGTGLGLAVVHGIVKQSDGHIEVDSEAGAGASFKIYLPTVEQPAPPTKSLSGLGPSPSGTETILLVEDEEAVRALARNVLRRCGYTVLEAGNRNEALRVSGEYRKSIQLLVVDVVLPGIGGQAVAMQLLARRPQTKVLYISGYTDDALIRHGILQEQVNFLQKPFLPLALAHKIREVLAG